MSLRFLKRFKKQNKKYICSNCKTGAQSLRLDERQWACPFSVSCTGDSCVYFAPLEEDKAPGKTEK